MLAALGGCTWAPGPALDGSRIQDDLSAKTGTDVYPVKLITADVVRAQPDSIALAAAVPDSPARTGKLGADLDAYEYLIGPQDLVGVTVLDHPEMSSGLMTAPVTGATAPVPGDAADHADRAAIGPRAATAWTATARCTTRRWASCAWAARPSTRCAP